VTPVGVFLPALDELFLYGITSKVTSDCLADCLGRWWEVVHDRFAHITTLVINLDNGPENPMFKGSECPYRFFVLRVPHTMSS
jgi:hypothetical protein